MNGFIVSLGLTVVLQHVVIRIWSSDQKSIADPVGIIWEIGDVRIIVMRVVVVAITAIAVVDHLPRARAQPLRPGAARQRRRPGDRRADGRSGPPLCHGVFIYGSMLAGLGGALLIALFPITPFIGSDIVVQGFRRRADRRPRQRRRRGRRRPDPRRGRRTERGLWPAAMDRRLLLRPDDPDPAAASAGTARRNRGPPQCLSTELLFRRWRQSAERP